MELHIATSKEAADYDYATFNGTRTLTLAAGKSSLVIKPGTIIGYRDGRNVVYVVTPDKGLNSEYKISEDDFDRKVAPKCDSATKAQARKAFSGKVEKPAATVAPKPTTLKRDTRPRELGWYIVAKKVSVVMGPFPTKIAAADMLRRQPSTLVNGIAVAYGEKLKGGFFKASEIPVAEPVKSPVKQVAKETKAEIAKRNAETHKVIERAAKRAGEESLRKTKEKVAPPKDLPITEKDIKAMAKKLKLPGGAGAVVNDTSYTWNKKGGFADSVLNPLRDNLKANGFTETDAKTLGLTGNGSYFTDGKYVVYTAAHLGAVKTDNWYLITLTPVEKKA